MNNFHTNHPPRLEPRFTPPNIRTRVDPGLVLLCQLMLRAQPGNWVRLPTDDIGQIPPSLRRHARPCMTNPDHILLLRSAALGWVDNVAARCGKYAMARASSLVDEGPRAATKEITP